MKKVETEEGAINKQRNWKVIKRKMMAEKKGRKVKKKKKGRGWKSRRGGGDEGKKKISLFKLLNSTKIIKNSPPIIFF